MSKAKAKGGDIRIGRVLHEDDDFVTMEIAKHDKVTFHLQQNEQGETVGGDRFLSLLFVRNVGGQVKAWNPFSGAGDDQ